MRASYDVIVVGGGPAGWPAAAQSARLGARTLLIEKNGALGGTMPDFSAWDQRHWRRGLHPVRRRSLLRSAGHAADGSARRCHVLHIPVGKAGHVEYLLS